MTFEETKKIVEEFAVEVNNFTKENRLNDLKEFSKLQEKENIGADYRQAQWFFENISYFKAKYFSLKAYFTNMLSNNSERTLTRKVEGMINYIEQQIKHLDIIMFAAKQRIKFYESVIYLVGNFNYGNY